MFVLVTGATGAIGPYVVNSLLNAGHSVRTLSIDPPSHGIWPGTVESIIGDITNLSEVKSAMLGIDAVIHLAALLHIFNPPAALEKKYEEVNVGGTANVVCAAVALGAKRIILCSTIAVYGPSKGAVVTEETVPAPQTFYEKTKWAAERIVLAAHGGDGSSLGTVLRLGAVYGPRVKGNYQRLLQSLAQGRFVPVGKGDNRRTLIYVKDVARAIVLALQHPSATGKLYNVTDGTFCSVNEIIEVICAALGRRPSRWSLPVAPVRLASGAVESFSRLLGINPPVMRSMIDKYVEDVAVDGHLIQEELGFAPQYDLRAGWMEAVCEIRKKKEIL